MIGDILTENARATDARFSRVENVENEMRHLQPQKKYGTSARTPPLTPSDRRLQSTENASVLGTNPFPASLQRLAQTAPESYISWDQVVYHEWPG